MSGSNEHSGSEFPQGLLLQAKQRCLFVFGGGGGMHSKGARTAAVSTPLGPRARL
jgi:hypothetical protein